ncbi:MAG: hypothetical protein A2261_02820 [Candidatus Magasanikbacteria bacterium RIFOXYA2_FULL_44_8]|uniref:PEGA domain-containing protein n=1 Tax=Candidatus Magasanikbacteria bacterium RIFOXYA2_FULL_44_8 TaxID=1798696 RepID=A0A1F6NKL8_9BACT|nr:MAG: hypothetical protein A2261_02820 [Candidatus Magasanikbacteria bacterium RIFOXYA2_FULL_44_8]
MEYRNSYFIKPFRQALFALFTGAFLLLTPAIILYTEGYRYDWHNGLLREIGAISIDIEPNNAVVFLDGLKIQQSLPIRLKNISPRKYHIKISAAGYYDWERDFEVKNKQTVYIKEVSLIKKESPTIFLAGDISTLAISSDNRYLVYILQNNQKPEAHIFDTANSKDTLLTDLKAGEKYKITWAQRNNFFSITNQNAPYETFWIYGVGADKKIDLASLTAKPIMKYQWKDDLEPELFFSADITLSTIKPTTQNIYKIANSTFIDWWAEQGRFWTLQTVSTTKQIKIVRDSFGFSSDFAILDSNVHPDITPSNPRLRIAEATGDRVVIKYNDKENLLLTANGKIYNVAGNETLLSPYQNWLIMWTPWEIWTHTMNEEPYLLNRSGEGLKSVIPLDKYNTLALVWNGKATILYPYYQVTHDFINAAVMAAVADTSNKKIYFVAKIDKVNGIWKLNY